MIVAANKRKRNHYADLVYILSHSILNENWKPFYEQILGEKINESQNELTTEQRITLLEQAFGSVTGMRKNNG